jgi:phosphoesterase RecJ-like protein
VDKEIFKQIEDHDSIVIARHKSPDLDAYGSQFGLYYALKKHFPAKRFYVVGDTNGLNYFQEFDTVSEPILRNSLYFIIDTSVRQMLGDDNYLLAKKVIVIDHHQNDTDLAPDLYYKDAEASSSSEMIARFLIKNGIEIDATAAKPLYMGIVGDTGRFQFSSVKPDTFRIAAVLLESGINLTEIYNLLYIESLETKRMKAEYLNSFSLTRNNVGYRKNDAAFLEKYRIESQTASRMLANQLSGIKEIPIWANFTLDIDTGKILCELRSRKVPIIEVAKKYGGGGHLLACGATVASFRECDLILEDLDRLLEEYDG